MSIEAATFLESHRRKLSFAVHLFDDYSKASPIGLLDVHLNDGIRAIKNSSSYYLFLDLPDREYRIEVVSAYYFRYISEPIKTLNHDARNPVTINLLPRPSYPFADGETLIRGLMLGGDGKPIIGGKLSGRGANEDFSTATTETGEFVIYFGTLAEEDVVKEDGRYFVKGYNNNRDEGSKINISIEYAGTSKAMTLDKIEVGKTRSITIFANSL